MLGQTWAWLDAHIAAWQQTQREERQWALTLAQYQVVRAQPSEEGKAWCQQVWDSVFRDPEEWAAQQAWADERANDRLRALGVMRRWDD